MIFIEEIEEKFYLTFGRFFSNPPHMSKKIIGDYVNGQKEEIFTLLLKLIVDHTFPESKTTVFFKKNENCIFK